MKQLMQFVALNVLASSIFALTLKPLDAINFFPKSIITLPEEVNGIAWSSGTYFALSAAKYVCFALSEDYESTLIQSPGGNICYLKFVRNEMDNADHLLVFTENNVIGVKTFTANSSNTLKSKSFDSSTVVNSIDFSSDGKYIIMGQENGDISLMPQSFISGQAQATILEGHEKGVYAVSFSPDSKYFVSAGKDKLLHIWSMDGRVKDKLFTIPNDTNLRYPVTFTNDSTLVVSVPARNKIIFRDFAGNVVHSIKVKGLVRSYSLSKDSNYLFVLTDKNFIDIYDIRSGDRMGYVPPFNATTITKFAFNADEDRILVGHKDGTVFYLKTEEVVLAPDVKPPRLGRGPMGNGGGGVDVPSGNGRKPHSFEVRTGIAPMIKSSPYTMQVSADVGYTNASLINPLYFGGLIKAQMAFPSDDFPSKYYYHDEPLPSPQIDSIGFLFPLGFAIPFGAGLEMFAEVQPGAMLYTFWFPGYGPSGMVFPSFIVEMCLGIAWRGISIYVGGNYDTQVGFSFGGGVGYRIQGG